MADHERDNARWIESVTERRPDAGKTLDGAAAERRRAALDELRIYARLLRQRAA